MKFLRLCRRPGRRWLALLLVPPALWLLLLLIVPTDWARARLIARMERATGRSVRLGGLHVGLGGGVRLRNLEIGEADAVDDPWLRVDQLHLDLHLLHLLVGQCDPARVEAEGLALRIHRRQDGSFEFGDLLATPAAGERSGAATHGPAPAPEAKGCTLEVLVRDGRVSLIDEATATSLEFLDVEARGVWQRKRVAIQELRCQVNGGSLELVAQLDRSAAIPAIEGHARAHGVALGAGMGALGYLAPVVAGMPAPGDGRLDLDVYLRGQGATGAELAQSLVGQGSLALDPIRLDASPLIEELATVIPSAAHRRVGAVRSQFAVARGRVATDDLTIDVGPVPILLAGWTDFDGRLDYRIRQDGLTSKLPREAHDLLADLPIDLDLLASLRVQGTLADLDITIDGVPLDAARSRLPGDRARMQEIGRRLRDRLLK